jgi:hypothetical protein
MTILETTLPSTITRVEERTLDRVLLFSSISEKSSSKSAVMRIVSEAPVRVKGPAVKEASASHPEWGRAHWRR